MSESKYIYDTIGNQYERKNLKTKEYLEQLENVKILEKDFLDSLKYQLNEFSDFMQGHFDKKEIKLRLLLKESKRKLMFYKRYKNLSYDYELEFKINELRSKRLPEILDLYNKSVIQKNELKKSLKSIDKDENRRKVQEFKKKKMN